MSNNIDKQYQDLLKDILYHNNPKVDRTGTGTISVFGRQIRHKMSEGFPLLTTKKMPFKTMVTELLWFLKGDTNIKFLVDNGCNIWNGDAYKAYKTKYGYDDIDSPLSMGEFITKIKTDNKFAKENGELGPIYGKQWRRILMPFDMMVIDQIQNLINDLKTNPDSRRLMVNAWNVGELGQMVLPPCHYGFQVYTRELSIEERLEIFIKSQNLKEYEGEVQEIIDMNNIPKRAISLMWNQRSVDTFLGLPFNIASYALLLEIIAKEVNMVPDELIGNLGDVHLYSNHIDQAKLQIERTPFELPKLKFNPIFLANLEHKGLDEAINGQVNFELENYKSHPSIKAPLSN
jgi:thymidylate synthase